VTATLYAASGKDRRDVNDRRDLAVMLAHGAGANQTSAFMVEFAQALAARGFDTITFNFLYSEAGKGPPDRNDRLEACYRAMIAAFHAGTIAENAERSRLVIGGKSMGGRIASQVVASQVVASQVVASKVVAATPDGVAGLVLLGYPLHPPGRPDKLRSKHLPKIAVPMLVVQGSRDTFGTPEELRPILKSLKAPAELYVVEGGDHSFKVPKRGALPQAQVHAAVLDEIQGWLGRL
jgi:predicted alpha/beta-hydrolase family hydrolase